MLIENDVFMLYSALTGGMLIGKYMDVTTAYDYVPYKEWMRNFF